MASTLRIRVRTIPLKLRPNDIEALKNPDSYDWILFASKNAVHYFAQELHTRRIKLPHRTRIAAVGPSTARELKKLKLFVDFVPKKSTAKDMLNGLGMVRGEKLLFPRSALAKDDIARRARALGSSIRIVPLYTNVPIALSPSQKIKLLSGSYSHFHFSSPSGIAGLMSQLNKVERMSVRKIPAHCIGPTTARAAKVAGFTKISIEGV
jgi:uroporphyrinogen-III synthase